MGRPSLIDVTAAEITCEELREKIHGGDEFALVDALSTISFAGAHLPGAIHIPPERVDALAPRRIPDRDGGRRLLLESRVRELRAGRLQAGRARVHERPPLLRRQGGVAQAGLPLEGGRV